MAVENDIVLIHMEDQPISFARIESIAADHKRGWHHVKLLLLQVPLQTATWILRDVYINGDEFTMGGNRMRLEKVVCPEDPEADAVDEPRVGPADKTATPKVISFKNSKKTPGK
jgi:hypothetical protein